MQYEVEVGGRVRNVTVARTGDTFAVAIDGHARQVEVTRIDGCSLSLIVDSVRRKDITVSAEPGANRLTVLVGTTPVPVVLNGALNSRVRGRASAGAGAAGSGPQRVIAPMPGKIVRILVRVGETVRARQPVIVVEAMKMENELGAGRDGAVAEIHTAEGVSVDAGALLIVIQ